jgi:hypothetical protein
MREINLGLDFVRIRASRTRSLAGGLGFAGSAELGADLVSFVVFQRTGVGLLLSDPDLCKHVKNGLALDFQFSGQIVDSNLAHPPSISSELSAKSSFQPHGFSFKFCLSERNFITQP